MASAFSLMLAVASLAQPSPQPRDVVIRVHEGKSLRLFRWTIEAALADGRPTTITINFNDKNKFITVALAVSGQSWGEQRLDDAQFPELDLKSLGLSQVPGHVLVRFEYGAKAECRARTDLNPEVTVDFTPNAAKLFRLPGYCSGQERHAE